ncbi:MAG: sigma factor [Thermaerobacter sp.]|nr:sigma factor [Thermaerobacter sp.]
MGKAEDGASWVEAWVNSHGDRITQFAYTYTHDWEAAQDIAQETFLRLYRSRTDLQRTTRQDGWLTGSASTGTGDGMESTCSAIPRTWVPRRNRTKRTG